MAELLFLLAILLLVAGWCFSVPARYRRTIPVWRQLLSFIALASLTAAVAQLLRGKILLENADFQRELEVVPRLAGVGLILTFVTFVTCWFSTRRALMFILPSAMIVGFLWFMALFAL